MGEGKKANGQERNDLGRKKRDERRRKNEGRSFNDLRAVKGRITKRKGLKDKDERTKTKGEGRKEKDERNVEERKYKDKRTKGDDGSVRVPAEPVLDLVEFARGADDGGSGGSGGEQGRYIPIQYT